MNPKELLTNLECFLAKVQPERLLEPSPVTRVTSQDGDPVTKSEAVNPASLLGYGKKVTALQKLQRKANNSKSEEERMENPLSAIPLYSNLSLNELKANLELWEWEIIENDPSALTCWGQYLANDTLQVALGQKPIRWNFIKNCTFCGAVFVSKNTSELQEPLNNANCPWCINRLAGLPIPNPIQSNGEVNFVKT